MILTNAAQNPRSGSETEAHTAFECKKRGETENPLSSLLTRELATKAEALDQFTVTLNVCVAKVCQKVTAMADLLHEAAL